MNNTRYNESSFLRYVWEVKRYHPRLTKDEREVFSIQMYQGDVRAREVMILHNLPLVIKIARYYEGLGLPLLDLINEGNIALIQAATNGYDPDKAKFSTYAALKIKGGIKRALSNQSRTIRIPVHMADKLRRVSKIFQILSEINQRDPTEEELAEELGVTLKTVTNWRLASHTMVSLEAPIFDDGTLGQQFGDKVVGEDVAMPYDGIISREDIASLRNNFSSLSLREQSILTMRFGTFEGKSDWSLEEIGQRLGYTRERIRQIQNEALVKLKKLIEY